MHVTYQLCVDDYYQGYSAWRNRRKWQQWLRWVAYVIVGFATFLSLILLLFAPSPETRPMAVFGVVFGVLWFGYMLIAPKLSTRRQFRYSPMAQSAITLDISETGLEFHNLHAESRVAWSAYFAWGEAKSLFVIMPQPRAYICIPKRAFTPQEVDEFRDLLRRHIGKG